MQYLNAVRTLASLASLVVALPLAAQPPLASASYATYVSRGPLPQDEGLFAGIKLTPSQNLQIRAIQASRYNIARHERAEARHEERRAAPETTHGRVGANHTGQIARIRALLTAPQLVQFNSNLATLQNQRKSVRSSPRTGE